ncbi:MAG: hypothetical protein KIS87_05815 [Phycisphaeraceae bacterium]|nr:hypothetical protein [Phycisphaeraceae bacterium]
MTKPSMARAMAALTIALVSVVAFVINSGSSATNSTPEGQSGQGNAADAERVTGSMRPVGASTEDRRQTATDLCDRLSAQLADCDTPIEQPHLLHGLACSAMTSVITGDPSPYILAMQLRNSSPDIAMMQSLREGWVISGLIDSRENEDGQETRLFLELWESSPARLMALQAIAPESLVLGRGMAVVIGQDRHWPYHSVRGQLTSWIPAGGRLSYARGMELHDSPQSAFVSFGVRFTDGSSGHIRMHFYYDTAAAQWYPITLAVASESEEHWPIPFW